MEIEELRQLIDEKDDELSGLFVERMELCKEIGKIKAERKMSVTAAERENEIIVRAVKNKPEELAKFIALFYRNIFSLSKAYQSEFYAENAETAQIASSVIPPVFSASVAAVAGENAFRISERAFPVAAVTEFKNAEGALKAAERGFCDYAILPAGDENGFSPDFLTHIINKNLSVVKVIEEENGENDSKKIRYAALSAKKKIFSGADRMAFVIEAKNSSGSLLLPVSRIAGAGLNVTEIKSLTATPFKTEVFIEFEGDVTASSSLGVLADVKNSAESFKFLGAYRYTV